MSQWHSGKGSQKASLEIMLVKRQSFKRIGKRKRRRRRIWKRKVRVVIQEQREVLINQSKKKKGREWGVSS